MAGVQVRSVTRNFGQGAPAVKQVSLDIADGSVVSLLGPSGCGKTTTLRMIAGLERPDAGEIRIGDELVSSAETRTHLAPERRNVGMVFQSYAVWPHLSVFDNVAYPLQMRKVPRAEIALRVANVLDQVGMSGHAHVSPTQLSGGMQQRVALARSLVFNPAVLLMDEPFSGLDAPLRERMGAEVRALHERVGVTSVYVTHDQAEAMVLSDRVAVMHEGEIVQEGTPQDVYLRPNSRVVAEFLGFATEITAVTESVHFAPDDRSRVLLRVRGNGWDGHCFGSSSVKAGDPVTLTVRPDAFELAAGSQSEHATSERAGLAWTGTVRSSLFLGSRRRLSVAVGNVLLRVETRPEHAGVAVGSQVTLWAPAERVWAIVESASSPA